MAKRENPVYAYVRASQAHGYGHIYIDCFELFGYSGPTLRLSCQMGGESHTTSYAWEFGLSNDYGVIGEYACHKGYLLMRRANRVLKELNDTVGYSANFANYAVRALQAAGVRKVYFNDNLRGEIGGKGVKELPCLDTKREPDLLEKAIFDMESTLILLMRR
ncbi:lipid kinase [Novimethylophilus kurashikiensis]|uniref:Lipid kinase n=1 Tax=Novimethylophilus kurashikiensis TaxID=1825523 RepID=A0A2R5F7X0_9PROT|nr:hypothetical protein [Novimethylophilus kurashikiensis]GBG14340.1 lipid kinase [Novimethylophilus kurashikiensis]